MAWRLVQASPAALLAARRSVLLRLSLAALRATVHAVSHPGFAGHVTGMGHSGVRSDDGASDSMPWLHPGESTVQRTCFFSYAVRFDDGASDLEPREPAGRTQERCGAQLASCSKYDATDSVAHAVDVMALCDLPVVCGAYNLALPMMACGVIKLMSILSNVAPSRVLAITKAMEKGDTVAAREAHRANVLLVKSLFVEPNPVPTKKALELLGRCASTVRSP
ncbi:hypothetical protein PInf_010920 [Phytophthora infestans]|nr:hypothetical protein PInf_010920 [Phytophthora infestans]